VVEACRGKPARHSALRALLHGHLELARRVQMPLFANESCSLLANLLYWEASFTALGPDRAARVLSYRPDS
jgi:hypothetical protein